MALFEHVQARQPEVGAEVVVRTNGGGEYNCKYIGDGKFEEHGTGYITRGPLWQHRAKYDAFVADCMARKI